MNLRSALRLRDYEIRSARGDLERDKLLVLNLRSPVRGQIALRELGSDILTFNEVLGEEIYRCVPSLVRDCNSIIDLGANIGLASLYFASHYPSSRLFSVEPNPSSFELLTSNLSALMAQGRCRVLKAAVWGCETVLVADDSHGANHHSAFATRVATDVDNAEAMMGQPIHKIIAESGFECIDLLKVDIEGAEVELFTGNLEWLTSVRSIAIEFHGDSRDECAFDRIMKAYGFRIYDEGSHTIVALKND